MHTSVFLTKLACTTCSLDPGASSQRLMVLALIVTPLVVLAFGFVILRRIVRGLREEGDA